MQNRNKILLFLLAVCLVLLQASAINRRSFWEDEAATASLAPMEFGAIVRARADNNHPPLYWLSVAAWGRVFGYDELSLKSYSLLWMLIAFFLVYKLAGTLNGERAALIAATLLVFSPYVLTYGHNARYYAMSAAISLFLAWMTKSYVSHGRWIFLTLYAVAGVVLLYTLYMGATLLFALNLWYLRVVIRQKTRPLRNVGWLLAQIIILVSYLPWLGILLAAVGRNLDRNLELGNLFVEFLTRYGYIGYAYLNGEFLSPLNPLVWLLILLVVLTIFFAGARALKDNWLPLSILFVCLTLSVVVNLVSVYPQSAWQNLSNRTFFVFPFFVIWLAGSLANLRPKFTYIGLGIIMLVYTAGIFNYFNDTQMVKPLLAVPWRAIMQTIDAQKTSQAVVLCSGGDTACNYYLQRYGLDDGGLWNRERIVDEPPPELWWIQINLGARNLSEHFVTSYVDQVEQMYEKYAVFNYAPQDPSIRMLKTDFFHQIDYEYRVSLYHFSSMVKPYQVRH